MFRLIILSTLFVSFIVSAQQPSTNETETEQSNEAEVKQSKPEEKIAESEKSKPAGLLDPFVVNPYFSLHTALVVSNQIALFGDEFRSDSWKFNVNTPSFDLKSGNGMYNARLFVKFSKDLIADKDSEVNYNHDPSKPTGPDNPLEIDDDDDTPNALDIMQGVSFSFIHPTVRKKQWGTNLIFQAGKFHMPFGLESLYDHELNRSALSDEFIGGGFNDIGVLLANDFLLSNTKSLTLSFFLFNGINKTMLDSTNDFHSPAFGFDLRFKSRDDFYSTVVFSIIQGSVYHDYKIKNTINKTRPKKKNLLIAVGTDTGYNINDDLQIGISAEFNFSKRQLDKSNQMLPNFDSSYTTWGAVASIYTNINDFGVTARANYFKAPYPFFNNSKKNNNSKMVVDVESSYGLSEYLLLALKYTFEKEIDYEFKVVDSYKTDTFNHHTVEVEAVLPFDYLWEKGSK